MAHTAPPSRSRRRLEIGIAVVAVLAAAVLAGFAIVALHHPSGRNAPAIAAASTTRSGTTSPAATGSASPSTPVTTPSSTEPASSTPASSTPPRSSTAPASSTKATPTKTSAKPTTASHPLAVSIMNNTSDSSLETTAASRLKAKGWSTSDLGAFQGSILSTAVYYDPTVAGAQAQAQALQAQFPVIKRVVAKFDGLGGGPLVLMLTSDYS